MSKDNKLTKQLSVYERQQLLKYGLFFEEFLKKGEMPVEYFTGKVDFAGLILEVNQQVLIPRVETEELVDHALTILKNKQEKTLKVIDLATGSGAIALALINQLRLINFLNKKWEFYLIDISEAAISVAQKNYQNLLSKHNFQDQVKVNFIISDLFEKVERNLWGDLLLANLPYIPSKNIQKLPASVRLYEPLIALDGGKTGFELIAKALNQVIENNLLAKDAILLFETDFSHDEQFVNSNFPFLLKKFEFKFIKDQFARHRFLQLKKL